MNADNFARIALLALLALPVALPLGAADTEAERIVGRWLTEPKDGIIEMVRLPSGKFEGKIVGGSSPGRLDAKNPDQTLRSRVLRGQAIVHDLTYAGDGSYTGGTIYDPDSGKTYKLNAELRQDGTLKIRGYIGFSLLGRSQVWTRYTDTSLDLPAPAR